MQLPNGITKKQYYEFCSHFGTQARKVKAAEADYQKELARAKKKADKLLAENTEKIQTRAGTPSKKWLFINLT